MKIIIDTDLAAVPGATVIDNVTLTAASSEDAAFPAANLRNDHTTDLWKAANGVLTATITLTASKGSAVELYNTNATSATVRAGTGGAYELETGYSAEAGYSLENSETGVSTAYYLPGTNGRLWADYPAYTGPHIVTITLTALTTVYAGIVRAGAVEEFRDPAYGLSEGSIDYSIEKELNNGADYFRKRNVVRTFEGLTMLETMANAFLFKHSIFDAIGPKPVPIRLSDTYTDQEFVLFAKRDAPPKISPVSPTHWRINYGLKEVI